MSMIKLLSAENQFNKQIFSLIDLLFKILSNVDWLKNYLFWELDLLKLSGYELNLDNIVSSSTNNGNIEYYVENSKEKKIIPSFLIDLSMQNLTLEELLKGYNLVSNYIDKNILIPNNLSHPIQRLDFINLLK